MARASTIRVRMRELVGSQSRCARRACCAEDPTMSAQRGAQTSDRSSTQDRSSIAEFDEPCSPCRATTSLSVRKGTAGHRDAHHTQVRTGVVRRMHCVAPGRRSGGNLRSTGHRVTGAQAHRTHRRTGHRWRSYHSACTGWHREATRPGRCLSTDDPSTRERRWGCVRSASCISGRPRSGPRRSRERSRRRERGQRPERGQSQEPLWDVARGPSAQDHLGLKPEAAIRVRTGVHSRQKPREERGALTGSS